MSMKTLIFSTKSLILLGGVLSTEEAHAATDWYAGRLPTPSSVDVCFLIPHDHLTGPVGSAVQAFIANVEVGLSEFEVVSALRFNIKNPIASGWRLARDEEFGNEYWTSCNVIQGQVLRTEDIRIFVRDRTYRTILPTGTTAADFDLTDILDPVILGASLTVPGCTVYKGDAAGLPPWDYENDKFVDPVYDPNLDVYAFPSANTPAWNGSPNNDLGNPGCWYNTHLPQWVNMDTILHEFGHAIGLSHEMNRLDSTGECHNIRYQCANSSTSIYGSQYCNGTSDCPEDDDEDPDICGNDSRRLRPVFNAITRYDVGSIMHYKVRQTGDSGTCPPRTGTLTAYDKLAIQYMYPVADAGRETLVTYWQGGDRPVVFRPGWDWDPNGTVLAPQATKNQSIQMFAHSGDIIYEFWFDQFDDAQFPIYTADFAPTSNVTVAWTFTDHAAQVRTVRYTGQWPDETFLFRMYDYSL